MLLTFCAFSLMVCTWGEKVSLLSSVSPKYLAVFFGSIAPACSSRRHIYTLKTCYDWSEARGGGARAARTADLPMRRPFT